MTVFAARLGITGSARAQTATMTAGALPARKEFLTIRDNH